MAQRYPKNYKKFKREADFGPFAIIVGPNGTFAIVNDEVDRQLILDEFDTAAKASAKIREYTEQTLVEATVVNRIGQSFWHDSLHMKVRKAGDAYYDQWGRALYDSHVKKPDADKEAQLKALRTRFFELRHEAEKVLEEGRALLDTMENV